MTHEQRVALLAQSIGADIKILLATKGDLTLLTTDAKANFVAAINELQGEITALQAAAGGGAIDDTATNGNTSKTWSADKIFDELQNLKSSLLGGAGAAFDTLGELATELGDQDGAIAGLLTAVGNRVRFDAAQSLTSAQMIQARANIGALSTVEMGNPDADLVAVYTAAKA